MERRKGRDLENGEDIPVKARLQLMWAKTVVCGLDDLCLQVATAMLLCQVLYLIVRYIKNEKN